MPRVKYTDQDREAVIYYFLNNKNNSDRVIAEYFGFTQGFVCSTITRYIENNMINIINKKK